jgi:hypothetical protein
VADFDTPPPPSILAFLKKTFFFEKASRIKRSLGRQTFSFPTERTENEWCILRLVFRKHRADWVR